MSPKDIQKSSGLTEKVEPMSLTPRELEIATALGRGERLADIARRIGVHKNVTGCYAARAREKLGLYNRHQLAAYARAQGWT